MTFIEQMHEIAREKKKRLVLPEGTEKRTLEAAAIIVQKKNSRGNNSHRNCGKDSWGSKDIGRQFARYLYH